MVGGGVVVVVEGGGLACSICACPQALHLSWRHTCDSNPRHALPPWVHAVQQLDDIVYKSQRLRYLDSQHLHRCLCAQEATTRTQQGSPFSCLALTAPCGLSINKKGKEQFCLRLNYLFKFNAPLERLISNELQSSPIMPPSSTQFYPIASLQLFVEVKPSSSFASFISSWKAAIEP